MKAFSFFLCCLLAISLFSFLSCDNSSKDSIPKYTMLITNVPNVSADGTISPSQALEYKIVIASPLQQDSLELLQDHLIKKGKSKYPGVNKIIARVFIKGVSDKGLPYASMILIGDKKEIQITGSAKVADFIHEKLTDYEILGCWVVYKEDCYIICQKDGQYYETYINKQKQKISELQPLSIKERKGYTAYYKVGDLRQEYMIIKDDGLYLYDESGESGNEAVIWSNDPTWEK